MKDMAIKGVFEKAGVADEKVVKEKEWIVVEAAEEDDFVMIWRCSVQTG